MARISDLPSISILPLDSVFVVSDGTITSKINLADLKTNVVSQATANIAGTVKVGAGLDISDTGVLSVRNFSAYTLPVASATTLGGVRVGSGLRISDTSVLSLDYTLPTASPSIKGGVRVGSGLSVLGETLSVDFPDFTVFDNSGLTIGNSSSLKLSIETNNTPTIKEQVHGLLNFSILDANKPGGFSEFRFVSGPIATILGGSDNPALVPDIDGGQTDLGLPSFKWNNVHANSIFGNLTGNVIGNSIGAHTGNVLAADSSIAYNATLKQFTGNLVGNITGTASSASRLSSGVTINNVPFDGTGNIVVQDSTKVALTGGVMSGFLTLHAEPTNAFHAATKAYVDGRLANAISIDGGTMAGFLTLNGLPTNTFHATPKLYVDNKVSQYLPLAGGTMANYLTLNANPISALHAATKGYTDAEITAATGDLTSALTSYIDLADNRRLLLSGGTMTGYLNLHANPVSGSQAANKNYVDTSIAAVASSTDSVLRQYIDARDNTRLPTAGGTMTGFLTLNADPTANLHAATKQYVDTRTSGSSATLTGYTDQAVASRLSNAGGTLTGFLTLHADPTAALHASTKRYVDGRITDTALTPTYGVSSIAAYYYNSNNFFDVYPPAGKTMSNFVAFIPSYGSSMQSPYYYWWYYYYDNNQLTWSRLGDRIRVYINNNYYYYYYYYNNIQIHWLALWR